MNGGRQAGRIISRSRFDNRYLRRRTGQRTNGRSALGAELAVDGLAAVGVMVGVGCEGPADMHGGRRNDDVDGECAAGLAPAVAAMANGHRHWIAVYLIAHRAAIAPAFDLVHHSLHLSLLLRF